MFIKRRRVRGEKNVYLEAVGVDPVHEVAGLGVDTGVAGLGTAVVPADDSGQLVAAHEGTAGVSLAGVLAALLQSSADHGVSDVALAVGVTAVVVAHHGNINLHQDAGEAAAAAGGSPAGDGAHGAGGVLLSVVGNADGPNHAAAEVGGLLQVEDADVVGDGPAVVVLVEPHLGHSNVLLLGVVLVEVVVAHSDSESAGGLSVTAVASGHNLHGADQRPSAHQRATNSTSEQSDLVRELPGSGLGTSDDLTTSSGHGGGQELGGKLLRGSSGQGHDTQEDC